MRPIGIVAALLLSLSLAACSDDDPAVQPPSTSSTTAAPSTTATTAATTSSSVVPVPADQAIWPVPGTAARFADPVAAVRSFAKDYLGMTAPVVGAYRAGEPRAGEVEVRRKAGPGPVTVVSVRELKPGAWSVVAAASDNLRLESPDALQTVSSPLRISGRSTAFEAEIGVGIRADGQRAGQFLAETHTMGGANGEMGPFATTLEYGTPRREAGAVLLFVMSAEDGSLQEATVVRVRFG
ncbi:MAG TPA: Gmad2 immunoglobulin-like domain-containing protein [Acidimicrobiales bacterium]|nr:Gmad2 immunoglobulin-like domain-containing protein [Acidimicrobiales bacterium]